LGYPLAGGRGERFSESTAKLVDDEVRRTLAEAHERVTRTLAERREQLDRIARRLLECEVLDQATLLQVMAGDAAPAAGRQPGTPEAEIPGVAPGASGRAAPEAHVAGSPSPVEQHG
jgi:cell division protease FtsH